MISVINNLRITGQYSVPVIMFTLLFYSINGQAQNTSDSGNNERDFSAKNIAQKAEQQKGFQWSMVGQIPGLIAKGKLTPQQIPNPHWKDDACLACHEAGTSDASASNLRHKQVENSCANCHDAQFDHSYIHPINVEPDEAMKPHINPVFKQALLKTDGKVSCSTCHDLTMQCLPQRHKEKGENPSFFRAGPFKTRTEQCYFCHDKTQYKRLNPHDQVDDKGKLKENTCRICHAGSIQDLREATSIEQVSFHAKDELSSMCWGCHRWLPHPGGRFTFFSTKTGNPDHLVKPSEKILNKMNHSFAESNIDFPLDPNSGRIFCGTCHYTHEKGVIKNEVLDKAPDEKRRLRTQKICTHCHDK